MTRAQIALSAFAVVCGGSAHGAMITNGSMNGNPGIASAPTSWTIAQDTPDVVNANGPFNNTGQPWTSSPDGGTFARLNGVGDHRSEAISQVVSGYTPGEVYALSYSVTNLGFRVASSGAWGGFDGIVRFLINGVEFATSSVVTKPATSTDPIVWITESRQFVAPSESFTLTLYGETTAGLLEIAYTAIDGVDVTLVPVPATMAPVAIGVLAWSRRRRAR